jgi:transcriptional regulator with XRE-family HTH domain
MAFHYNCAEAQPLCSVALLCGAKAYSCILRAAGALGASEGRPVVARTLTFKLRTAGYERGEIKPSIDTAKNIADALGVTIDYLIGGSDTMVLDKELLQRMEDIQKLGDTDKGHLFALMDAFLQKNKLQQVLR